MRSLCNIFSSNIPSALLSQPEKVKWSNSLSARVDVISQTNQPHLQFLHQPHTVAMQHRPASLECRISWRLPDPRNFSSEGALHQKPYYGVRVDIGGRPAVLEVPLASKGDWQRDAHRSAPVSNAIPAPLQRVYDSPPWEYKPHRLQPDSADEAMQLKTNCVHSPC